MRKNRVNPSAFKVMLRVLKDMKQIRWLLVAIVFISLSGVAISLVTPTLLGSLTDALYNLWADGTPIDQSEFSKNAWSLAFVYILAAVLGIIAMIINTNAVSRYFT